MELGQLTLRQQQLLEIGTKEGLIEIVGSRIRYVHQGKEYDFTDPEEPVRAATYVELVKRYQYPPRRIDFEQQPPARLPPIPSDIVVFNDDAHSHAFIVTECKPTSGPADLRVGRREGLSNANLFGADYLLVACGDELEFYDVSVRPTLGALENKRLQDLPIAYATPPSFRFRKSGDPLEEPRVISLHELHSKFQRCHNYIWEGGKRGPDEAFDEMSKLMFAKIYDERHTPTGDHYSFQAGSGENAGQVASRVKQRFRDARAGEPTILQDDLQVSDSIIYKVVSVLQDVSLTRTDLDSKGQAFEKFLGKVFRGELGQFFTPRQVIDFMVKFVDPGHTDLVIDPACGSGGFLLYVIDHVIKKIGEQFVGDEQSLTRLTYDYPRQNVFGIEVNKRIARIAMMDMVIHDDGHTNIEYSDALVDYGRFDPRRGILPSKYHIVLTNPPFGDSKDDPELLNLFDLGRKRKSQRSEVLFLERCLHLVRPGGKTGIVLPDGILNNQNDRAIRQYIDEKAKVLGIVSLPTHTFMPFGSGMQTSMVFMEKRQQDDPLPATWGRYPVFMAIANHVGYDSTGRDIPVNDLPAIFQAYATGQVGEFAKWITPMQIQQSLQVQELREAFTLDRMDPKYYFLATQIDSALNRLPHRLERLANVADIIKSGSRPGGRAQYFQGNVPSLEGGNITAYGSIDLADLKFIPDEFHYDHMESAIKPSDILVVKDGATTGKVAIVPADFPYDECNINEHLFKVTINDTVDAYYVFAFLYGDLGQRQIQRLITGGAQKGITREAVENILIPVPPPDIQRRIANLMRTKLQEISRLHAQIAQTDTDGREQIVEILRG